jgi:hypothetical protein
MNENDFQVWSEKFNSLKDIDQVPKIKSYADELSRKNLLSKALSKQLKNLYEA